MAALHRALHLRPALLAAAFASLAAVATVPAPAAAQRTAPAAAGVADSADGDRVRRPGAPPPAAAARTARAVAIRPAEGAPRLDGRLDDAAWADAEWVGDFRQRDPVEGAPTRAPTEVAFLYDEEAFYIGARMRSLNPGDIQALVSRRDNAGRSERIVFSLDTYHDRRTAYSLGITASGVRFDYYHGTDNEYNRDYSWDPVWEAKVTTDSLGWSAELRIPFSQLRFNPGETQVWGLNMNRYIPALNEDSYWVLIPKNETGWSSRMAVLSGIGGVRPSRRIELIPYVAASSRITGEGGAGNPFDDGRNLEARAGGDFKMGLGPNLTLDATINPDFGQVEADPAEVNLSAVETVFSERRPFFTEGAGLLSGSGANWFYSRRIGAAPRGFISGEADFVDRPQASTILGAAKITGRLPSGLSIGGLTALTDEEYARTYVVDGGLEARQQVAPRAGYGVLRLQQEFGPSASTVGVSLTGVRRDLEDGSPLATLFTRDAYAGGVDWTLRFGNGGYVLGGAAGVSHVAGDEEAIARVQRSSAHYLQRPDQDHVEYDPTRTSLTGYLGSIYFEKNSGRHWLYEARLSAESPLFDINDAGRVGTVDDIDAYASLRYRENAPTRTFQNYGLALFGSSGWNFGGIRQFSFLDFEANGQFRNFWQGELSVEYFPSALSDQATRGGPLMETVSEWNTSVGFESPFSSAVSFDGGAAYGRSALDGWFAEVEAEIAYRPSGRWELAVEPSVRWNVNPRQYVTTRDGGSAATYGGRYIFGRIEQTTISAQVRFNYAFTPDLTVELYAEPFAASGRYTELGELAAARTHELRLYGTDGTTLSPDGDEYEVTDAANGQTFRFGRPDFRVLSFRSNAVLRWAWRPGSTLFLVWQQDRFGEFGDGRRVSGGSLWDAVRSEGDHYLALKIAYWLPVS